jgi:hypothetical protein
MKRGVVIDTMSFIDTGYKQSVQRVDVILVNNNGTGRYFIPRESRYQIIFPGIMDIIVKEVGNPDNWVRKVMYALPYKPILSDIELDEDLREFIGFDLLDIYWHTSALFGDVPPVKTYYEVWLKKGTDPWDEGSHKIAENLEAETYTLKLNEVGTWYIRVRGKNYKGNYGPFSSETSIVISSIMEAGGTGDIDNIPPELDLNFGEYSSRVGEGTETEYAIDSPSGEMAVDSSGEKVIAPKK